MSLPSVLVTGAPSGIGRATARRFCEADWRVHATAPDPAALADLADRGCHTHALDVTDVVDIDALLTDDDVAISDSDDSHTDSDNEAARPRLDCLVNSAGFGQYGPPEDVPTARLARQFDVRLLGPHRLCRAALPALRAAEGTVVTVSSLAAHAPFPGAGAYCASKSALESHHDMLRVEFSETNANVDVVLVEPGPVDTGFRERRERELAALAQTPAYADVYDRHRGETTRGSLFGEVSAADVADAVFAVATDADPPARRPIGWRVRVAIALSRIVPDSMRERVYERL